MANSRYDYHKDEEKQTDLRFNRETYIIIRIDGHRFHTLCSDHNFQKPNDKRALDLMVESAKHVMRQFKGHIPLAYGHSDEFSFLIRSTSNLMSRRVFKITSMLPVVFATFYNSSWDKFFDNPSLGEPTARKYDAWFDARPKEYANYRSVLNYFRWRQVDCHINNLYNTTLHAMTGRYVRHELMPVDSCQDGEELFTNGTNDGKLYRLRRTPISNWISDNSLFHSSKDATEKLSKTVSSDKHDIMFLQYKINYNNELEQFKKGTVVVDTQSDYVGSNPEVDSIKHYYTDITTENTKFWDQHKHIFDDYVQTVPLCKS